MRRPDKAGSRAVKTQRRKTLKRRNALKAARPHKSLAAGEETEVARLRRELNKSLQQQTATADVLKVISRSTFDLKTVLNTLIESAARLCEADVAAIHRQNEAGYRQFATYGHSQDFSEYLSTNIALAPARGSVVGRTVLEGRTVHIEDVLADPEYALLEYQRVTGFRTALGIPLLREGKPIGVIFLGRCSVRPFTEQQIELVSTFADQAVIAIENVRLFEAEQKRTRELSESLEQQTATSEVLQVISSSTGELQPVFQTMLENATRLCEASYANMFLWEGDAFRMVALHGDLPAELMEYWRIGTLFRPRTDVPIARVAQTRQAVHVIDLREDRAYLSGDPLPVIAVDVAGARTLIAIPMLKEGELVGAIAIYRKEVRPFTDKQIELVTNFAAQAVIAIENARLLSELRESLAQQTATSDVLKVIASSTGELEPVFGAMLANATRLCGASYSALWLCEGDGFRTAALHGDFPQTYIDQWRNGTIFRPHPDVVLARVAASGLPLQVADLRNDPSYLNGHTLPVAAVEVAGIRTMLVVPMFKDKQLIGEIAIYRQDVRPFTDRQIELVKNFAAQAVVAIENAQLLSKLRQRTTDLSKSLEDLRTAQDRLVQTQKLASLGQLTAGIAHEIKNPLNFVNNFSAVSVELIDELREALAGANLDNKLSAQISEIADMLQGNLDKVVQHGKRADSIVKNMLLHSRQGSQEHRPVDINAIVEESLNLAYHGARAEKQGFNITLERSFDPAAGEVDVFPQDITRVLLNLISNGFYAATKRKAEANGGNYEATLSATTKNLGDSVEIRIRDNGTGIPPQVKEKIFNPFFTTKPAGEGTGLGLSISHDIIVKQHGGSIEVDTQPGQFTEFRIVLPRGAATIAKSGERP